VVEPSIERVRGAVLDVNEIAGEEGLVVINANTPASPAVRGDVTGPVAERVLEVLERDVNPQIAMHGGGRHWSRSKGDRLRRDVGWMSGMRHGPGDLSQGIAVAITDAVRRSARSWM